MFRQNPIRLLFIPMLFLGLFLFSYSPAAAASGKTYKIYCGPGPDYIGPVEDLIQAIEDANDDPGLNTIAFITNRQPCYFNLYNIYDHTNDGDPVGLPIITDDLIISANGGTIQRLMSPNDDVYPIFRILHVEGDTYLKLGNLTIKNGLARSGAGVHNAEGHLELFNVFMGNNHAQSAGTTYGGAVYTKDLTIQNARFINNSADAGGAIRVSGQMTMNEGHFYDNTAEDSGGAVKVSMFSPGAVQITNSDFGNNVAQHGGGALHLWGEGDVSVSESTFTENSANFGGAVTLRAHLPATASLANNLFVRNSSSSGDLDVLMADYDPEGELPFTLDILNNTFVGDVNGESSSAMQLQISSSSSGPDDYVHIYNNIITNYYFGWKNTPLPVLESANNLYYNNVQDEGNVLVSHSHIYAAPEFVDAAHDDYRLLSSSPAIDSGLDTQVLYDLLGVPRPQGESFDIGAYEYDGTTP